MIEKITNIICAGEGINDEIVFNKTRKSEIIYARQLIQSFCYEFKAGSYKFIGEQTGNKDHSTVIHSCGVIKNYLETDKIKAEKIKLYRDMITEAIAMSTEQKIEYIKHKISILEKQLMAENKRLVECQNMLNEQN